MWLGDNPAAERAKCDEKQKEVEMLTNPILKRAYESANAGGGANAAEDDDFMGADVDGAGNHTMDEPSVEELD